MVVLLLLSTLAYSNYTSPFNNQTVQTDSSNSYSFIVTGHLYGDGPNMSNFPANTLLGNLKMLNGRNATMLVCLGDLFKDIKKDISNYERSLFSQLEMPLINTVGNHDLSGNVYQENYGETSFLFELNGDLHLVLDTERNNGDILADQMKLIDECIVLANRGAVNNTFIYIHRTIWKDSYPVMKDLFMDNTQGLLAPNFEKVVLPKLKALGELSNVFIFSGSLGDAPASFFYFKDEKFNIQIIGTAIRTLPRDAVLEVSVVDGDVRFETISLTGQDLLPLTDYDIAYWQTTVYHEPVNWGLVVYKLKQGILHRYFWSGFLISGLLFTSVLVLLRRRKNRMN